MIPVTRPFAALALAALLAGCAASPTLPGAPETDPAANAAAHIADLRLPAPDAEPALAAESFAGLTEVDEATVERERAAWLRKIRVELIPDGPVSAAAIVEGLVKQGLPIVSDLPLQGFTYAGPGVLRTDAESALRQLFPPMGLDYTLDHDRRLVQLHPWRSETFWVPIGRRNTSFASGAGSGGGTARDTTTGASQEGAASEGADYAPGASIQAAGENAIAVQDDFWPTLREELEARLSRCIPAQPGVGVAMAPASMHGIPDAFMQPTAAPRAEQAATGCTSTAFGQFSLHPDTGAVNVQAPRWLLDELRPYFARINAQYNTSLEFAGRLFMYTHESRESAGVDLAAFADVASRYGFVASNSSLGVVFSPPSASGSPVSVVHNGLTGSTLGLVKDDGALRLFSNFMVGTRRATLIDDPVANTTSGVPVRTRDVTRRKVIQLSQTASGADSGATATQNLRVPVDVGTDLRINPRYDPRTGLIRAQVALLHRAESGSQAIRQYLNGPDAIREVESEEPVITEIEFSGEGLFRPGDMVLFSAKTLTLARDSEGGTRGLKDSPLGFLFGNREREARKVTFYFALEARMRPFTPLAARF